MTDDQVGEVVRLLDLCTEEQRRAIYRRLRGEFPVHPLETKLHTSAEVILEAIDRGSDLTLRGVKGIIAEASFMLGVVPKLEGWQARDIGDDQPYDALLSDGTSSVRVQVKMQRSERGQPKMYPRQSRSTVSGMYSVEVQRTRTGKKQQREGDDTTTIDTRPYRYGEFDLLAVSMYASTSDWSRFMYTPARWLIPRAEGDERMKVLQPVAVQPNDDWTDDLLTGIGWYLSDVTNKISEVGLISDASRSLL